MQYNVFLVASHSLYPCTVQQRLFLVGWLVWADGKVWVGWYDLVWWYGWCGVMELVERDMWYQKFSVLVHVESLFRDLDQV
jgi:hypothetical protein